MQTANHTANGPAEVKLAATAELSLAALGYRFARYLDDATVVELRELLSPEAGAALAALWARAHGNRGAAHV